MPALGGQRERTSDAHLKPFAGPAETPEGMNSAQWWVLAWGVIAAVTFRLQ